MGRSGSRRRRCGRDWIRRKRFCFNQPISPDAAAFAGRMDSVTALPKVSDAGVDGVANVPELDIGTALLAGQPQSAQHFVFLAARARYIRRETATLFLQRDSSL